MLDSIDGNNGGFFTGTAAAPASYTPQGEVGGAFAFDGTTYVQVPTAPGLQPPQVTLEAWVYPVALSATFQTVISCGPPNAPAGAWWLGLLNGIPQFGSSAALLAGTAVIPLNAWTHLAATFDGSTQVMFVNGSQVASQATAGPLVYGSPPPPVTIGAAWQANGPASLFTGRIDEVSLYQRALAPAEIAGIVAAGPAGKSTTGPYITTDPELPAAIVGQPYTQAFTSIRGTAPGDLCRGSGRRDAARPDPEPRPGCSPERLPPISGVRVVFAKPVGTGTYDSYTVWLNSGVLNAQACNVNGCDPQLTAPAALAIGTWHHVAYAFDGTAQQQVLYLDGGQVASSATTLAAGYDTQSLYLGRDTENGAPNYFLQGCIDEAAVYDRALTAAEIAAIYNAGPAGKASPTAP